MEDTIPKEQTAIPRSACTECQRRKQKCNREWPCNHCQKRKVADKCRFSTVLDEKSSSSANQKRQVMRQPASMMPPQPTHYGNHEEEEEDEEDDYEEIDEANLEALGYSAAHFLSLSRPKTDKVPKSGAKQYYREMGDCSQLDHALQVLPPRPYTDMLVQHFLNIVNFHYYIIHPESFVKEYEMWWNDRYQNKPLPLPWTSLLMMVCACSAQYPEAQMKDKLERDLGQSMQKLSEKYHTAGRELYNTIPVGNSHLYTVQQLLHSCYWFKSEARYVECWHALTAGIREAQELGIHQESIVRISSESDKELRRRVWCLLSIWDWQIGSLLSRPLILDPTECDVQLPGISLESYEPSPVLAMKLQAEVIWKLSRRFGRPTNVTTANAIEEYKGIIERWISRFPPSYAIDNTDKRMDGICFWITLHRHYLHTASFSMALDPTRPYLAKPMSRNSPAFEQGIRRDGVKYALKLMGKLYEFFTFIYPKDTKFHSILFYIFDTAALLCSAVLHDQDHSLPRRDECLKAIEASLNMLQQIQIMAPSAKKPYEMLSRLTKKLDKQNQGPTDSYHRKRPRMVETPVAAPNPAPQQPPLYAMNNEVMPDPMMHQHTPASDAWVVVTPGLQSMSPQYQQLDNAVFVPSPCSGISGVDGSFILSASPGDNMNGMPVTTTMPYDTGMLAPENAYQDLSFANITEAELGTLAGIWDYNTLNLDYVTPYHGN